MAYAKNVFINCPFDGEYRVLLKPLLFTLLYLGYEPKISQTISSANIRINQIKKYIRQSKFGIHDISRNKGLKRGELPRFNMPYELGLDIGCQAFGITKHRSKRVLILDRARYHYMKVLSDIAGQDISNHNNDPQKLVEKVRNWFSNSQPKIYPSYTIIWKAFNQYSYDLEFGLKKGEGYTKTSINNMPITDFIKFCKKWIADHKSSD